MQQSSWSWLMVTVLLITPALAAKRNIVLYIVDDMGRDAGCYGNSVIKTPNIDRLAAEGTRFDYAFCTTASCSASRSVILTGLHNHLNGQYGHEQGYHHFTTRNWVQSLPVLLQKGGYRTARTGKFHVGPEDVYKFDESLTGNAGNPVALADSAQKFIAQTSDKPFFLYICTIDPHRRGGLAEELPYKPDRFGNLAKGQEYPGVKEVRYDPREVGVPDYLPDTAECRAELAQYYQSVSRADQGLGRLIKHLKDAGVYDDTLILFISDHGIAFLGAKTTVYEPGLRSPCVIRNPYAKHQGIVSQAMISWVDLTPTILDFAGLYDAKTKGVSAELAVMPADAMNGFGRKVPYVFHGRSFLSVIDQERPDGWDEIHASHTFHEVTMYYPMRVVRQRKWKLIWNIAHALPYPFASDLWESPTWQAQYAKGKDAVYGKRTVHAYIHRPKFELYDLENDPDEIHNRADDPAVATTLNELKSRMKVFQKATDDPWLLKWEYE